MPIPFQCSNCKTRLNAPDSAAGKRKNCPRCKAELVIPANKDADDTKRLIEGAIKELSSPVPVSDQTPIKEQAKAENLDSQTDSSEFVCPVCKRLVKMDRTKCMFCGEMITPIPKPTVLPSDASHMVAPSPAAPISPTTKSSEKGTRPCKFCQAPVSPKTKACPGCGGKSPYPLSRQETLISLGIIAVLFLTCCVWLPNRGGSDSRDGGSNGERYHPKKGEKAYIEVRGEKEVWVSVDEDAMDELNAFSREKNESAIRKMILQDRVLVCDRHTQIAILDPGIMSTTVRIMDGKHDGKKGIVPNEFLRKN